MLIFHLSLIDTDDKKSKFELIYNKYHKLIFYIANQILCDELLVEDAVQDSFIKIIENLDKIQDINCNATKSFIVIIVRNHSINLYNNSKKKLCVPLWEVEHMLFKDVILEGTSYNNLEKLGVLGSAITQLPIIYRNVITLKFIHEFTNKEIALSLNINESTIRKRIERAKKKIQALLEKES